MQTIDCSNCGCSTPLPTQIPGPQGATGAAGANGTDGYNSFSITTADFVVPAVGAQVTVLFDSKWVGVGQNVFISPAGTFSVVSKPGVGSAILEYLDYFTNTATGNTVATGSLVSPGGFQAVVTGVSALTDNSTGTASDTLAAGVGIQTLSFYINLANLTNADILTTYTPGYAFKILGVSFAVETAATTALKLATITPKISGVATTGGVLSLTSENCTPKGNVVSGTAVTAANTGSASAKISLTASAVTAFVEGSGWILIKIANADSQNAIASLAAKVNALITGLTT